MSSETMRQRECRTDRAHEGAEHIYLSTGCYHNEHDYCQAVTGHAGPKVPATCKFCAAPCVCACHQDQP